MNYSFHNIQNIDSINPLKWGKAGWIFLFSIALTYDVKKRKEYETFFISLKNVLPCEKCRNNYNEHLNTLHSSVFDSKQNLLNWLLNTRNNIAKKNNVPKMSMNDIFDEINYYHIKNHCHKNKYFYFKFIFIIILLIIFIFLMFKI